MSNLLENPATVILAIATLIALLLYRREASARQKVEREGQEFLEDLKQKGWETLHQSIQKSQDILGEAELEGVKIAADSRYFTEKMEKEYADKLSEIIKQSQSSIAALQDQFFKFMTDLQKRSQQFEETSRSSAEGRINQLFERLETKLSDFLVKTESTTTSSIELELKSARELIESYKNQQLKLIDENIIAMMEQTLAVVLGKKLSLKEQVDLVYEALEKAKIDKFIV